ncbi:MAG: hypothetical protein ACRDT4_06055 [Micromonosporaceae bacterium]
MDASRSRVRRLVLALSGAVTAIVLAVASPAHAAVQGLQLVWSESDYSSTWWRSPDAYCPSGKSLVGMGTWLDYNDNILFRGLVPIQGNASNPIGAQAAAHEGLNGTAQQWRQTTYAICGYTPSGLVKIESGSPSSSTNLKTWTASCPSGKKVLGAGGTVHYGDGRVKVDEIRPNETLDQVTVTASEDQYGTGESWSVRAYAICAYPPPGLVRVRSAVSNGWNRSVGVSCPSEKVLLSVAGGVTANDMRRLRVTHLYPFDTDAAEAEVRTNSTSGLTGEVRAYAICADG